MLIGLTVAWGLFWPLMQVALAEIGVFSFRALCAEAGGALLLVMALAQGYRWPVARRDLRALLWLSLVNATAWLTLSALGVILLGAGRAVLVAYTMPLWAFVLGAWVLHETPARRHWLGLVGGLAGIGVLVTPALAGAAEISWLGLAATLAAALCWAGGATLMKARRWSTPMPIVTAWHLLLGGLPLCLLAALLEADSLRPLSTKAWLAIAYNVVVGVALGTSIWFRLVQTLPMAVAGLGALLVPAVGLLASALLLNMPLGVPEIAALVLIVGGVAAVLQVPARRRSAQ